jgi:hypothetical protein
MNYDHLNKAYDYWMKDIRPYLVHNITIASFDDYLRKFSFLPSGKWIHDAEKIKLIRIGFAIDPKKFVKKYKDQCVTYNAPIRPEDGMQRVIYQFSPTFHLEMGLWIWIENNNLQSYGSFYACYHDESEFLKFSDEMYKLRREGNTEEKGSPMGFLSGVLNKP